jgi:hypothetical protein
METGTKGGKKWRAAKNAGYPPEPRLDAWLGSRRENVGLTL